MNLDALRVKESTDLSVPELDFLEENKAELFKPELEKFKLNTDAAPAADELSEDDKQTLAAIKDGKKKLVDAAKTGETVVEKERLDRLEATAEQYRTEKVQDILSKHIKRGAIKQDQTEFWSKQLLAASEEERKGLETALDALLDQRKPLVRNWYSCGCTSWINRSRTT